MAVAEQGVKTWSFNSGFYTCALGATQIIFPVALENSADLQAFLQNPTVILGVAQLDQIAREEGKWSDHDFRLGCFQGTKAKMTVAEIIAGVKAFYPQAAPFLPSIK